MMVVISFHIVSRSPIPHTLPGLLFGISTRMLQCRRVGSLPMWKAVVTMLSKVSHGCRLFSRSLYQFCRSLVLIPIGPGDFPIRMRRRALMILVESGASSRISNHLKPRSGDPCSVVLWYNSLNSLPMQFNLLVLRGNIHGCFL